MKTRNEIKERQKKWREAKAKYRSKMNPQKKVWVKRKDKLAKQEKRQAAAAKKLKVSQSVFKKQTLYNRTSQAQKVLRKSPHKFAEVIHALTNHASPRKKEALKQRSKTTNAYDVKERRVNQKRHSHAVNISLKLKKRSISHLRKRRNDAVTSRIKSYVSEFYFESSRPLPHKRYATKYAPAYVLQTTLKSS